jgi:tetratricopeptide (TPR) repeat protein
MIPAEKPQALEGAIPRRRALGARLRQLAPWLLGLALVLIGGSAFVTAGRRNLVNRTFLIAARATRPRPIGQDGSAFRREHCIAGARDEALRQLTADLADGPLAARSRLPPVVARGKRAGGPRAADAADESGGGTPSSTSTGRTANPNLLGAWERLGRVYYHTQRYAEAAAVYEHLLQVQTRSLADTFDQLAAAYTALGRPDDARTVLVLGLEQHPFQRELQLALADNARAAGDLDEADAWYARLLAQQPDDAYAWARRGELALQGGRAEAATIYLEQAVALEPTAVGYWLSLAAAAAAAGELDRATTAFERSIAMRPDDVGTLLAAARFFGEAGQHSRARAIYERILSLEPNNGPAREALAGSLTGSPTP